MGYRESQAWHYWRLRRIAKGLSPTGAPMPRADRDPADAETRAVPPLGKPRARALVEPSPRPSRAERRAERARDRAARAARREAGCIGDRLPRSAVTRAAPAPDAGAVRGDTLIASIESPDGVTHCLTVPRREIALAVRTRSVLAAWARASGRPDPGPAVVEILAEVPGHGECWISVQISPDLGPDRRAIPGDLRILAVPEGFTPIGVDLGLARPAGLRLARVRDLSARLATEREARRTDARDRRREARTIEGIALKGMTLPGKGGKTRKISSGCAPMPLTRIPGQPLGAEGPLTREDAVRHARAVTGLPDPRRICTPDGIPLVSRAKVAKMARNAALRIFAQQGDEEKAATGETLALAGFWRIASIGEGSGYSRSADGARDHVFPGIAPSLPRRDARRIAAYDAWRHMWLDTLAIARRTFAQTIWPRPPAWAGSLSR